jgi:pimeloyl-ACP methyl ester carboxylesterase
VSAPVQRSPLIEGRTRAADDPSLGIGSSNIMHNTVVGDYLRSLGVPIERPYVSLNLNMNFNLEWAFGSRSIYDTTRLNPTYRIADLAKVRPEFRVLLIGGYYDMTTPILAARHALTHSAMPSERVKMVAFRGPHAVFSADDETRSRVVREIRALISGTH